MPGDDASMLGWLGGRSRLSRTRLPSVTPGEAVESGVEQNVTTTPEVDALNGDVLGGPVRTTWERRSAPATPG